MATQNAAEVSFVPRPRRLGQLETLAGAGVDVCTATNTAARSSWACRCLRSFEPNLEDFQACIEGCVARLLKGTISGNLPIAPPTRLGLLTNLTAAKSLGLPFRYMVLGSGLKSSLVAPLSATKACGRAISECGPAGSG